MAVHRELASQIANDGPAPFVEDAGEARGQTFRKR